MQTAFSFLEMDRQQDMNEIKSLRDKRGSAGRTAEKVSVQGFSCLWLTATGAAILSTFTRK